MSPASSSFVAALRHELHLTPRTDSASAPIVVARFSISGLDASSTAGVTFGIVMGVFLLMAAAMLLISRRVRRQQRMRMLKREAEDVARISDAMLMLSPDTHQSSYTLNVHGSAAEKEKWLAPGRPGQREPRSPGLLDVPPPTVGGGRGSFDDAASFASFMTARASLRSVDLSRDEWRSEHGS
ncbi:hypothetical protein BX600DRAFT_510697 [Xylariales sp. PMI_506]|nr:hypothetical protein BX600DRAFT_510697 [Xylariales sp. PMI_506]